MALSEALAVERMSSGDVAGGLALSDAAGWNQNADDWTFFVTAGSAFAVRDDRGIVIATAAALPYDAATGWIAMVLVAAAHRHRGIARQLVDACVAALRESGRTPVLDATPAGAAVYAKIGFVPGFAFERWQGEGDANAARSAPPLRGIPLEQLPAEAARVSALDRAASGVDRSALWRAFLARPETGLWLAPRGDGFALRRAGRRAAQVGPIVAADEGDALALLDAALAGVAGPAFIDVPVSCTALAEALARRGFSRQREFVRMALGDARAAAARPGVAALAGPEFG